MTNRRSRFIDTEVDCNMDSMLENDSNVSHSNSNNNSNNNKNNKDINSINNTQYNNPTKRPTRKKLSMATRRRSQLLYLEKYGLNQPDWHTSQDDNDNDDTTTGITKEALGEYYTDEPEEIIPTIQNKQPQSMVTKGTSVPSTVTMATTKPVKRPVSIRNFVQSSGDCKRPKQFVKPQKSNSDYMSFPATEFKHVHQLMDDYTEKVYMEGYLYKKNELNSNGSACGIKKWTPWYVELCGPVLTLWDNSNTNDTAKEIYPQYINTTDSTVQIEDRLTAETRPNLFSLNSAGANRFLFQATDTVSLSKWILAIRLSCFECSRVQEIYTRAFLSRPQFSSYLSSKPIKSMEGYVQVRFPGSTGWKKFWASVSSTKVERKLFSKRMVPTGGQIMFYESKKAKYPVMSLQNVVQVYTVYPESPKLINMATLFKIEGSLYKNKSNNEQLVSASSSALIMSSSTSELVQWLFATFDSFKLYGRPNTLLDDNTNQTALNFAEHLSKSRLFLDPHEVYTVSARSDLLSNKKDFSAILLNKLLNSPAESTMETTIDHQDDHSTMTSTSILPENSTSSNRNTMIHPTHLRNVTCASDVSDEDDESMPQADSESDSDESTFKSGAILAVNNKNKPTRNSIASTVNPITPNTSKSSSEISDVSPSKPVVSMDTYLPPISALEHSFSTSILPDPHHSLSNDDSITTTSDYEEPPQVNNKVNKKKKKPFYAAQQHQEKRSNSMVMTPQWPMYSSTASIVQGDYHSNSTSNNWETSSVDPRMMMSSDNNQSNYFSKHDTVHQPFYSSSVLNGGYSNNDDMEEDDDVPIASDKGFTRYSLLDQVGQDRITAKAIEKNARATGKPLVHVSTSKQGITPRAGGLLGVIQEKEGESKAQDYQRNRAMMDEQLLLQERMMSEQRQQQMMMYQVNYICSFVMVLDIGKANLFLFSICNNSTLME